MVCLLTLISWCEYAVVSFGVRSGHAHGVGAKLNLSTSVAMAESN